ncbi:hypothetical protein [Roseimicrobium sp. ORNL1]|uniref:hypothetical protein n=1 Tax=Roseimicrobium sp. ORNL1 TaxID=2711231 RepID=UPI0013E1108C|nr:hypothetical protein [Roseimicrobium sp. ORNL1]QIF03442.1 hypothetical protein G5S37_18550 [Roseimicrobium sp. ORNL1]
MHRNLVLRPMIILADHAESPGRTVPILKATRDLSINPPRDAVCEGEMVKNMFNLRSIGMDGTYVTIGRVQVAHDQHRESAGVTIIPAFTGTSFVFFSICEAVRRSEPAVDFLCREIKRQESPTIL